MISKRKLKILCQYVICCSVGYAMGQFALSEWKKSVSVKSQKEDRTIKIYKEINKRWVLAEDYKYND
jgi:hypothetical protein